MKKKISLGQEVCHFKCFPLFPPRSLQRRGWTICQRNHTSDDSPASERSQLQPKHANMLLKWARLQWSCLEGKQTWKMTGGWSLKMRSDSRNFGCVSAAHSTHAAPGPNISAGNYCWKEETPVSACPGCVSEDRECSGVTETTALGRHPDIFPSSSALKTCLKSQLKTRVFYNAFSQSSEARKH